MDDDSVGSESRGKSKFIRQCKVHLSLIWAALVV